MNSAAEIPFWTSPVEWGHSDHGGEAEAENNLYFTQSRISMLYLIDNQIRPCRVLSIKFANFG